MTHRGGYKKVLSEGDFFGEVALLGKMNRTATIKSISKAKLIVFSEELIQEEMKKFGL